MTLAWSTSSSAPMAAGRATCWRPWEFSPRRRTARLTTWRCLLAEFALVFRLCTRLPFPPRLESVFRHTCFSEGALYALFLAVIAGHEASPSLCAVDNADHGLNPRFARSLMERMCEWYLDADKPRQILLTTHNPLILDGLPLRDDRVRLFTVSRTSSGRTSIRPVCLDENLLQKAEQGWSLSRLWVMGHLGGVPDV